MGDWREEAQRVAGPAAADAYVRVRGLVEAGATGLAAIEQVASQLGKSTHTVREAYYRTARGDGGGVKQRPRSGGRAARGAAAPRRAAPVGGTSELFGALSEAVDALARHAEALSAEVARAHADQALVERVRELAGE